ncbi:GRAM domain-containing protein, partial [[Eubacterium] cellulosolvens]
IIKVDILWGYKLKNELEKDEKLIKKVKANLFRGIEAVGGNMKITNKRIIFEPHSFNIQTQIEIIPNNQIAEVSKRRTLKTVPNGILIKTKNGKEYKFVVFNREKLIEIINGQIT